jgi:hypothetical protein
LLPGERIYTPLQFFGLPYVCICNAQVGCHGGRRRQQNAKRENKDSNHQHKLTGSFQNAAHRYIQRVVKPFNVLPAASQGNPNSTNGRFCPMKRPFSIMDGIGVFWALS